jgi:DNA-binding response OmpR family regulator
VPTRTRVVAIVNSNEDLVNIVREALEDDGFTVATAHIAHIKQGQEDFLRFLDHHDPRVVIWDLAPPYAENWTFVQTLRAVPKVGQRHFVFTTVNRGALRSEVQAPEVQHAHELLGRRDDLNPLMKSVAAVFKKR